MKFNKFIFLKAILILAVLISACSPSKDDAKTTPSNKDKALVYGLPGDIVNNINVFTTNDRTGLMTLKLVYSPLYTYTNHGINYFLAESVKANEAGDEVSVNLRKNVVWSDGKPFTADDVIFTFDKKTNLQDDRFVDSLLVFGDKAVKTEKIDDYSIVFKLPQPVANPYETFAGIFIAPKHIYKDVDDLENTELNKTPVGTGPYKLTEYTAGQHLLFTANETYMFGKPKIEKVIYKIMGNQDTAMLALKKGDIDLLGVSPDLIEEIEQDKNLKITTFPQSNVIYLKLNQWSEKLRDENLREAIFYALDRDEIMKSHFKNKAYYNFTDSFLPADSKWLNNNLKSYQRDTEKAKKMLSSVDKDKLNLKLGYNVKNGMQAKMALVIQQQLQKAGINLELMPLDPPAMYKASFFEKTKLFDMFLGAYTMGIDPDTYAVFFNDNPEAYFHLEDKELGDLLKQAKVETNKDKRIELYNKVQQLIQDTKTFYPFGGSMGIIAHNQALSGFEEAKLVNVFTFDDASKLFYK